MKTPIWGIVLVGLMSIFLISTISIGTDTLALMDSIQKMDESGLLFSTSNDFGLSFRRIEDNTQAMIFNAKVGGVLVFANLLIFLTSIIRLVRGTEKLKKA